ncbi:hypothetical protein K0M31_016893 [Melipona bicolor]|uniref:Uncharacterized protein n=1 Tax=Melipona bicolor TaxID=60889 RepID=A0AA40KEK8_9HYME|nr:hypothetical protein K0M31_016893 [Melipona bicolor]
MGSNCKPQSLARTRFSGFPGNLGQRKYAEPFSARAAQKISGHHRPVIAQSLLLESDSQETETRNVVPPTKNGHAPPPTESGKNSQTAKTSGVRAWRSFLCWKLPSVSSEELQRVAGWHHLWLELGRHLIAFELLRFVFEYE